MICEEIVALVLKFVNILIHSGGLFLLRCLQRDLKGDVEMVYLTNLSITELLINITSFWRNLLRFIPLTISKSNEFKNIIQIHSYIFDYTVLKFSLYMTMIIITLDRMFLIILNISYPIHWNITKAKCYVCGVWLVASFTFIVCTVVYNITPIELYSNVTNSCDNVRDNISTRDNKVHLFAHYLACTFNLLFLIVAVVSYSFIFRKFKQTRSDKKQNIWKIFRQSRFYVAALLVITFIIFVIPSDIIWVLYNLKVKCINVNKMVGLLTTISYAISYMSDGLIYIFMNHKVKQLFWKHVRNVTQSRRNKPRKGTKRPRQVSENIPLNDL